jgi:hypothetical protein
LTVLLLVVYVWFGLFLEDFNVFLSLVDCFYMFTMICFMLGFIKL